VTRRQGWLEITCRKTCSFHAPIFSLIMLALCWA
jgi:hypothetical protein